MSRTKSYSVRFANSNIGADPQHQRQLRDVLPDLLAPLGQRRGSPVHLNAVTMEGDFYQVRDLVQVGQVWKGCFAKLRDEAPHIISSANVERQIQLDEGDRILEKSFFLYYENTDILVFQLSRNVGFLTRFANYWSALLSRVYVDFPAAVDANTWSELLRAGVREINFTYSRPPGNSNGGPSWTQRAMSMLQPVHGAVGKFTLRAPRGAILGGHIGDLLRWAATGGEVQRAKVLLQDETDPIDLFLAPIKVRIAIDMNGAYPDERSAYQQLADVYGSQSPRLPKRPGRPGR